MITPGRWNRPNKEVELYQSGLRKGMGLSREKVLRSIRQVFILSTLFVWVNASSVQAKEPDSPPNFIFILADDLGWGDLGSYGHPHIQTPNVDQLAREGMLFTQYYVASPICSPSRAALMTGHFPSRNKIFQNIAPSKKKGKKESGSTRLDPDLLTIADVVGQNGYRVGHFGKWHLGDPEKFPPGQYGIDESKMMGKKWPLTSPELRPRSSQMIVDRTIQFIRDHHDSPFFVNVWLWDIHTAHRPTNEQLDRYKKFRFKEMDYPSSSQVYYSVVTEMDAQIGRLMESLKEMGLAENTIVVFTSDNGPPDIYWGSKQDNVGSSGPFRGRKGSLYEGGIRVPFIIRWPGEIPAGEFNETLLSAVDLLPTFSGLAGIPLPASYDGDGEDMSGALLRGGMKERSKPLMWETRFRTGGYPIHLSPMLAVREANWKLLMNPDGSRVELYDIKKDPMEVDNLADDYPAVTQSLTEKVLAWHHLMPEGKIDPKAGRNDYTWPQDVQS